VLGIGTYARWVSANEVLGDVGAPEDRAGDYSAAGWVLVFHSLDGVPEPIHNSDWVSLCA
jgi:hypothetical protein